MTGLFCDKPLKAYIESRYPVTWPTNYTKETANRSYSAAVNIARMVRSQLGV
ncbi:MAG: hypothetical protein V1792_02640 [Pseudomonadota bacterium]